MRPISNVVDVTNYVMLERNQPLHAFDLARLGGRGIVVRLAADGETMTTLDGVERELTADDLLICDAERAPQAIAGIMGGATSEVSDATTEILLESAYFERMGIARTSKRLKLRSESSARFERGIDPDAVARNAERAMELLAEVAGARVAPGAERRVPGADRAAPHPRAHEPRERGARHRARRRGGVGRARAARHRARRRRRPATRSSRSPPTFRPDLEREIDLVEEVARRIGFDRIGRTLPDTHGQVGSAHAAAAGAAARRRRARRLRACRRRSRSRSCRPPTSTGPARRSTASCARRTRCAPRSRCCAPASSPGCCARSQFNRVARPRRRRAVRDGPRVRGSRDHRRSPPGRARARRARAGRIASAAARSRTTGRSTSTTRSTRSACSPMRSTWSGSTSTQPTSAGSAPAGPRGSSSTGRTLGAVGEVAGAVLDALGLDAPGRRGRARRSTRCSGHPGASARSARRRGFPPRPSTSRSWSTTPCRPTRLQQTLRDAVGEVLEDVRAFDVFRSDALGPGRRSLAFALRFRAPDRTLTDADVGELRQRAHRRGREGARRAAALTRCSFTTSDRATRRSTRRVSCSTPTGSRTSTRRRPASSSGSAAPEGVFFTDFDVMVVKAVLEWQGPAGFDDDVAVTVAIPRIGNASFDLELRRELQRERRVRRRDHVRIGDPRNPRLDADPGSRSEAADRLLLIFVLAHCGAGYLPP